MKTSFNFPPRLALLAALLLLAGCVATSVYPFFTAKDVVLDDLLVGKWTEADDKDSGENYWQFARTNGQAYLLTLRDGEETTEFRAHLFALKNRRFIDAEPVAREGDFIPPHYLLQVHRLGTNVCEMSVLNYQWLEDLLKERPSTIQHLWVDRDDANHKSGRVVLTAETEKLQKFILKCAADTNAFGDAFQLVRP